LEANKKEKYGDLKTRCNRALINQILRNVELDDAFQERYRSKKFKKSKFTPKRFYDKYSEKWKTIRWYLTGIKPITPSYELGEVMKKLFGATQEPFEIFRHHESCDGRQKCEKYFPCQHNFLNYDYTMRWLLQMAEIMYGFKGSFRLFKDEFPLVSDKVVEGKLRPMRDKICIYNQWDIPQYN
jgi:hypothetical protein